MKIMISGGHLTPALAFVEYVQAVAPAVELVFVGRQFAREQTKQKAREELEVTKRGVNFVAVSAVKMANTVWYEKIVRAWGFARAVWRAVGIIWQHKPQVFVSFGSYLAAPIAVAAWLCGVPIVTHEQTRTLDLANAFIAKFARTVAITFPETATQLPAHKVVVTGGLLRKQLFAINPPPPEWLPAPPSKPILYITGGSQGSEVINVTVARSLRSMLKDWVVIHQCGSSTAHRNYQRELAATAAQLPRSLQGHYHVREWVSETELAWIYRHATAMISRAGANTVQEVMLTQVPTIFVPIPFSQGDEQLLNAQALVAQGAARLIRQKDLTTETVLDQLAVVRAEHLAIRSALARLPVVGGGEAKLWEIVAQLVGYHAA